MRILIVNRCSDRRMRMLTRWAVPEGRCGPYRFNKESRHRMRLARNRGRAAGEAGAARVDALVGKTTGGTVACVF
ncbi:hypothetical protein ACFVW8_32155 [Streptomyces sp. NPDC058221]|uniref:hypothetical protein n=1 Tax=Streptomyces sp. NPDC058221 TaxID=3346388 RepID=UPI0036F12EFE